MAAAGVAGVFSYAGRTAAPVAQPLPLRVGGFGGAEGLGQYLREQRIAGVVDATHPFAARISANAVAACAAVGVPLIGLERPPWQGEWQQVPDLHGAVAALPEVRSRVFLGIGRQNLGLFAGQAHDFLLRVIDPAPVPFAADVVVARGPFTLADDLALLRDWRAQIVVAKNAGGAGAFAKIAAAQELGLRIIMVDRPMLPERRVVADVAQALRWCHDTLRGV